MDIDFSIIVIDKPKDWTSFDVVNFVRKTLHLDKAGHLGTLDPMVTGVLPIVLGRATKVQEFFMHRDKTYVGEMHLHTKINKEDLEKEMKGFVGKIKQIPPRKSAVKRQEREREVYEFKLLSLEKKTAKFSAKVEAGTYIRKLIHDLGLKIGGAHMTSLKRTQAGVFTEKDMYSMDDFKKAMDDYRNGKEEALSKMLIPAAPIIEKMMPCIKIDRQYIKELRNGSPIFKRMLKTIPKEDVFCVFVGKELVEIAKKTKQFKNPDIIAKPEVVFPQPFRKRF